MHNNLSNRKKEQFQFSSGMKKSFAYECNAKGIIDLFLSSRDIIHASQTRVEIEQSQFE